MRRQMKKMIETLARGFGWAWNRKLRVGALLLFLTILFPGPAKAFLDPCCALMAAGLTSISSALSSVIGGGLNSILGVEQDIQKFEQTVVWPQNLINKARSLVGNVRGIFVQIQTITQVPVNSATLAGPQQLEQNLLSRNPAQIAQTSAQYQAVYGPVPTPTDASPEMRDLIDSTDAAAQAALKRAIGSKKQRHCRISEMSIGRKVTPEKR